MHNSYGVSFLHEEVFTFKLSKIRLVGYIHNRLMFVKIIFVFVTLNDDFFTHKENFIGPHMK